MAVPSRSKRPKTECNLLPSEVIVLDDSSVEDCIPIGVHETTQYNLQDPEVVCLDRLLPAVIPSKEEAKTPVETPKTPSHDPEPTIKDAVPSVQASEAQKGPWRHMKGDVDWCDGQRIFVNRLALYTIESTQPHFLTFEEVLDPGLGREKEAGPKERLERALFTTYVYESEIMGKLIKSNIPICLIKDREGGFHAKVTVDSEYPNLTYVYPEKAPGLQYGVFHSKLMLLQFQSFLRVVVTSANLTLIDWLLLSQVIWLQDFPRRLLAAEEVGKQPFFVSMMDFLRHCFPKSFVLPIRIQNYDFAAAAVELIPSVSGRYGRDRMHKYGCTRVADIVRRSQLRFSGLPILTYQTSSIGLLKRKYLSDLYLTFMGQHGTLPEIVDLQNYIHIQYPTHEYICNAVMGPSSASSILLSRKAFQDPEFPKDCLHQLQPLSSHSCYLGMLYHAKVGILATKQGIGDDTLIYVGSHNISSSAWGKYEKGNTQLCLSNYELGVIFPPAKGSADVKKRVIAALMFNYPPQKYCKTDQPWIYEDYHEEPLDED